jgi:hypothetical protein
MWNGELNVGIPITWRNNETYIYAYIYFNLIIQTLFSLKRYSGMLLASIHIFKLNFIPLGAQRVIDTGLSVHSHELWNVPHPVPLLNSVFLLHWEPKEPRIWESNMKWIYRKLDDGIPITWGNNWRMYTYIHQNVIIHIIFSLMRHAAFC